MQYRYNLNLRRVSTTIGQAISITYSECVFVALGNQCGMLMRHIVFCDLSGSNILFYIIS